jgi:membrane protein
LLPKRVYSVFKIVRAAARSLGSNDVFRMAGATAFFTTFALPPILMILVRAFGLFYDRRAIGQALLQPLRGPFGEQGTQAILQVISSFRSLQQNTWVTVGLTIFLVFVATTLFKVVRGAINQLWCVRPAHSVGVGGALRARGVSLLVILAGGLLFLGVQFIEATEQLAFHHFGSFEAPYLHKVWHVVIAIFTSSAWFYLLFWTLPDGRPTRRIAVGGAFLTGLLFTAGKSVLGVLLRPVPVSNFYGASGALAILLLFLFYSALFLYAGAAIVEAWGNAIERPIVPKAGAELYRSVRYDP